MIINQVSSKIMFSHSVGVILLSGRRMIYAALAQIIIKYYFLMDFIFEQKPRRTQFEVRAA